MTVLYKVRKPAGSVAGVIFSFIALVILAVPYAGAGENREAIVAEQEAIRELFDAGEFGESLRRAEELMPVAEAELGTDHPSFLLLLLNLGFLYEQYGEYDQAQEQFARLMKWQEQTLGKDHLSTLQSANNLARLYIEAARFDEAEVLILNILLRL